MAVRPPIRLPRKQSSGIDRSPQGLESERARMRSRVRCFESREPVLAGNEERWVSRALRTTARCFAVLSTGVGVLTSQPIVVVCVTLGRMAPQALHKSHTGESAKVPCFRTIDTGQRKAVVQGTVLPMGRESGRYGPVYGSVVSLAGSAPGLVCQLPTEQSGRIRYQKAVSAAGTPVSKKPAVSPTTSKYRLAS